MGTYFCCWAPVCSFCDPGWHWSNISLMSLSPVWLAALCHVIMCWDIPGEYNWEWLTHSIETLQCSSVAQSCPTLVWPHGLHHARLPCPSSTPIAYSNSCPLSRWCHPTISSSVVPFSSCLQSFPASGSFPVSQFFTSDGQRIGTLASVLPMNIQDWFPLGWTGWISLQSKEISTFCSNTTVQKHQSPALSFLYNPTLTWLLEP